MRGAKRSYRRRFKKVVNVLVKYGFAEILYHSPLRKAFSRNSRWLPKREGKSVLQYSTYERIRLVIGELGTSFIKFAQIATTRPDLLPKELLKELANFQDHAPLVSVETIQQILKEEYKRPLEELFESIEYKPLASASIAQVHTAHILGGKEVVLKVQRPGIKEMVLADIEIMKTLARNIEKRFPKYAVYQPIELVKMFERSILKEIEFELEAANLKRFQREFKNHPDIYVPEVWMEYSTSRVLCMEYIKGIKITDVEKLKARQFNIVALVHKGIDLYFEQVFTNGFFHADPHPGNIFVMDNGQICFIDFGMMGTVTDVDKEILAELLLSLANRDVKGLKRILMQEFTVDQETINEKDLEYYIIDFFDAYSHTEIGDVNFDEAMEGLNRLFFDFNIRVPSNLLLLLKAMVIIEGVGLKLYPGYNIIESITPFARRLVEVKLSSKNLVKKVTSGLQQTSKLIENIPYDIEEVVDKIKKGKLHIEFEHKGLAPLLEKMEIVSNRLSFALVLAALIMGSSIIVIAEMPPMFYNISILGLIGFGISFILALKLLVSIIKHGNF